MKEEAKILKILFWSNLLPAVLAVILFESGVLPTGVLKENTNLEFVLLMMTELVTIGFIPLALYLFRIKRVRKDLYDRREKALRKWGVIRLDLLGIPLVVNTLLYYMFMNVSFGYLAIILLISMFFVYPSEGRCLEEVTPGE